MQPMLWFDRAGLDATDYADLAAHLQTRRPRVLAWAPVADDSDGLAVGLRAQLAVRRSGAWTLIRWAQIASGGWEPDTSSLRWHVYTTGEETKADSVKLAEPGRLPELFRERVNASLVYVVHVDIADTDGVTISARRNPADRERELTWHVTPGERTDLADPRVAQAVERALAEAKADYA